MPTILLYAPNASHLREVREALADRQDWELVIAIDGATTVTLLEKGTIDLLIIEADAWQHPVEDLLREASAALSRPVPILVLTAAWDPATSCLSSANEPGDGLVMSCPAHELMGLIAERLAPSDTVQPDPRLMDVLRSTASTFTIEDNNLEIVPMVARHLSRLSQEFGICRNGDCLRVAVALEEAMVNGIIHGNLEVPSVLRDEADDERFHRLVDQRRSQPPYCTRRLWVHSRFTPGRGWFTVRDEGPGFDPGKIPDPTRVENVEKAHGRGLFLIRTFMDSVSFNEQGNAIHLVKGVPSASPLAPVALN